MVPRPCAVEYRYRGIAELQLQARKQPVYLLTLLVAGLLAALSWVTREPGDPIVGREVRLLLVVLIVGGFVSWILGGILDGQRDLGALGTARGRERLTGDPGKRCLPDRSGVLPRPGRQIPHRTTRPGGRGGSHDHHSQDSPAP
jgi:hypothetical protein